MFQEELEVLGLPTTRFAPQTYDAVWAIALALREAQVKWRRAFPRGPTLSHFDYGRRDMAEEFLMHLGQLNFLGVSVSEIKMMSDI
ncbi:unnamed protein product [Timema podura]|uniref:Uncharacterized protein n=1 Tax=Timema podura TaxID=61482 RepID=A0ABN7P6T0_TIMPD|nr:unnamed protein product [Timema podura]